MVLTGMDQVLVSAFTQRPRYSRRLHELGPIADHREDLWPAGQLSGRGQLGCDLIVEKSCEPLSDGPALGKSP